MIKGWVRTTLIDYPGEIASIVFLGGCNMRCPMCHNAELVQTPGAFTDILESEVLAFLKKRRGILTGVVVSGGEPCLSKGLIPFLREIRALNLKIKLDTNGYLPEKLENLLLEGLVDFVAMDIKAPPEKYGQLSGVKDIDLGRINASIRLIRQSGLPYEFRTTVVPNWLTKVDIVSIADWLQGAQRYVLQQFRPQGCLSEDLNEVSPYPVQVLQEMQAVASEQIAEVLLRGI